MLFNSFDFLLFFPVVLIVYFLLPHKFRWMHLLGASCVFYMAFVPIYILILFLTIIIDYVAGRLIEKLHGKKRKVLVVVTIIVNILILAIFKYYNFFLDQFSAFIDIVAHRKLPLPYLDILLPIGLSFHTFQALSYIIEISRGNIRAEKHFGIYALYVMFFPQLVAGPIERPQNMLHQFHEEKQFVPSEIILGCKIMLWGFIKKLVIADRLSIYVNHTYSNLETVGSLNVWLTVLIFFPFQVYCDFSGYSSIAVGSAKIMGFKLMENFRNPFASVTTSELWNRWHISLSSWFRDYLYQPIVIALRDKAKLSVIVGLLVTFFLSGLWHGAGLSFIFYGLFQGAVMVVEFLLGIKATKIRKNGVTEKVGILVTFFLFAISLIFFRSLGLRKAKLVFEKMFWRFDGTFVETSQVTSFTLIASLLLIAGLVFFESNKGDKLLYNAYSQRKEIAISSAMVIVLVLLGVFYNVSFIYFQF